MRNIILTDLFQIRYTEKCNEMLIEIGGYRENPKQVSHAGSIEEFAREVR